jgi:hypothetical protein
MDLQALSRPAHIITGVVLGVIGLFCLAIAAWRIVMLAHPVAGLTGSLITIAFFLILGLPATLYAYSLVSGKARLHVPRSPLVWALIGLGVGCFWVLFGFVSFAAPQSLFVEVSDAVASITCPPLLLDNVFVAPLLNGLLYGGLAFGVQALVRRSRMAPRRGV